MLVKPSNIDIDKNYEFGIKLSNCHIPPKWVIHGPYTLQVGCKDIAFTSQTLAKKTLYVTGSDSTYSYVYPTYSRKDFCSFAVDQTKLV